MSIAHHCWVLKISTAVLTFACAGTLLAQQQPAPPARAPLHSLVGIDPTKTMPFTFVDAPVSAILAAMSDRLGFVVITTGTLPSARLTIQSRHEVGAEEAIQTVNEILEPLGYVTLLSNTATDPVTGTGGSTILRVVSLSEGIKAQIPVYVGADPNMIPMSDNLRTQIIPVGSINSVGLVNDLRPLMGEPLSMTANPGSNTIIITDTEAKIHRIVEIIYGLDHAKKPLATLQYRRLTNARAADVAQLINALFSSQSAATAATNAGPVAAGPTANRGGPARGGAGTSVTGRLYADSDTRTNMVILSGPDDQLVTALDMINRLDAIPEADLNGMVLFIKNLDHSKAADLSPLLNQIFGNGSASATGTNTTPSLTLNRSGTTSLGGTGSTNRGGASSGATRGGTTARVGP